MAEEFKAITTQEELNAIIADRIERAKEAAVKPYADYDDVKAKADAYEKTIGELNDKIKGYESDKSTDGTRLQELEDKVKNYETKAVKVRVAHEMGIPFELADKLSGSTEEEIKADAETFSKYMAKPVEAPLGEPEPVIAGNETEAALKKVVSDLSRR